MGLVPCIYWGNHCVSSIEVTYNMTSLCFKALVFEVSTVVTVVVDTGKLAGDTETLNDIKEIINKSKQTLLVFTKEVCFC